MPIDLVCVIDHSGSMAGEKMEYVKDSMIDILRILHKDDRLCLVEFDHNGVKLSPFLRCTNKNKREF